MIHYDPETGKVRVKKPLSRRSDTIFERERQYLRVLHTARRARREGARAF